MKSEIKKKFEIQDSTNLMDSFLDWHDNILNLYGGHV